MIEWQKYPMFANRTLAFAYTAGVEVNAEIVRICHLDKAQTSVAVARQGFDLCREMAESGASYAMCLCSNFSQLGWGTTQSNGRAFEWAHKAAQAEFPPGYFELGRCYEAGYGVASDLEVALMEFDIAVAGGFGLAAFHLSMLYHSGKIAPLGQERAIEYAIVADQLREPLAPGMLAAWYEYGDGVRQDHATAVAWYKRTASLGNYFASHRLWTAYESGELGVAANPKEANVFKALFEEQCPLP